MSLKIIPDAGHSAVNQQSKFTGAPSAPGVHDTLRSNLSLNAPAPASQTAPNAPAPVQSSHPLEQRLTQWRQTQENLKMSLLARQFGVAEPVRRGMELQIAGAGEWRPSLLGEGGRPGVAGDILSGRDCEVGWEDVFVGNELREQPDFHTEMEAKMRMNW